MLWGQASQPYKQTHMNTQLLTCGPNAWDAVEVLGRADGPFH